MNIAFKAPAEQREGIDTTHKRCFDRWRHGVYATHGHSRAG